MSNYIARTADISVTVRPEFSHDRSEPSENAYFWTYTIEIANQGDRTVQLLRRRWRITDSTGRLDTVEGPGVVGEQPTLAPGEAFRYASGCPLKTPSGVMDGVYLMVDDKGREFEVEIPAFSLDSPFERRTLN